MQVKYPSIKTIMQIKDVTKNDATRIKTIMQSQSRTADWCNDSKAAQHLIASSWNEPRLHELKLVAIDEILNTYGVEYIRTKKRTIYYCNAGDTYATTVMRVAGRYVVGCWGDIVERDDY